MELIAESHYDYSFHRNGDAYHLSVVCGTTAVYDVSFYLNAQEAAKFLSEGISAIEFLVERVRSSPGTYFNRKNT